MNWRSGRISCFFSLRPPYYGLSTYRSITNGRATPLGTKYFLEQGNIPLIHTLKRTGLNIHPLILNTPMHPTSNREGLDSLYQGSVLKFRTNCFHVYSRYSDGKIWYTKAVEELVQSGVDREGLVTIANVGKVSHRDDLMQVLDEAWSVTDQEYIDIITLQVGGFYFSSYGDDSIIMIGKKENMVIILQLFNFWRNYVRNRSFIPMVSH